MPTIRVSSVLGNQRGETIRMVSLNSVWAGVKTIKTDFHLADTVFRRIFNRRQHFVYTEQNQNICAKS